MTTLVTGATGFLGRSVVERLLAAGGDVRLLVRADSVLPAEWAGRVEVFRGDIANRTSLTAGRVCRGVDVVFHLAGEVRDSSRFSAVNAEGTRNLLEVCAEEGPLRVLHLSSVGVIGAKDPGVYDEASACRPVEPYEVSKWQGERIALQFASSGRLRLTVLRPAIVFGPRIAGTADSFLSWMRAIARGRFHFVGSGAGAANYVYVEDVADTCLRLVRSERVIGATFIAVDPCSIREFVLVAAECLGVPPPSSWPAWAMYSAASVLESFGRLLGKPVPLTRARVRALSSRIQFSGAGLRREVEFDVGWREGLRRTILAYSRAGQL